MGYNFVKNVDHFFSKNIPPLPGGRGVYFQSNTLVHYLHGEQILIVDYEERYLTINFQWGQNNFNKPQICAELKRYKIIDCSLGADHSLFLREDGFVYACGNPNKGQLGDQYYHPETSPYPYFPHIIFSAHGNKWIKVQAGDSFSVFLTEKGHVYTWGEGNYGRLGHTVCTSIFKPSLVEYFRNNKIKIVDIKTGGRHTFAISDKKELYVWGFGYYYQLATKSNEDAIEPVKVPFDREVKFASWGYFHSSFILGDIKKDEVSEEEN